MVLESWVRGAACVGIALACAAMVASQVERAAPPPQQGITAVARSFAAPPDDARPMMRWWWFGPSVVKPELEREILAMKAGGIGGFEIQPVYPLALDDKTTGFHNYPYLSPEFMDAIRFASDTAHRNGMRVDMTLASGWPYGGPHVPIDQASERLEAVARDIPARADSVEGPALGNGDHLVAMFAGEGSAKEYDAGKLVRLNGDLKAGRIALEASPKARVAVFYVATGTGQQVKRAALGAEGFVLDHFNRTAVDNHLHRVADPLMRAFGTTPPYAVFSDSLEVYSADWTEDFLPEFQRRRGYDLTPYLPQFYAGTSPISGSLRRDWGLTLSELIEERYLTPLDDWAKAHGTRFRSQTYGDPAVTLSSNRLVALPEGEGPQWNSFSFTRLATSASHLYGRPVTSSETWTWLHSPAFRATPLDMKAEADRFFVEGVNQLIGHGWPYTPPGVADPGWSFYAAAVFDDHNPWWMVMPDVTKYLQRMSYLLRQGKPANDVAVLLPNDDGFASFSPGKENLSTEMPHFVTPELTRSILSAGYNLDYIDNGAIAKLGIPYPVLVMPHVERLSPETLRSITAYVQHGGKVIAVGSKPSRAPGFLHAEDVTAEVKRLASDLFANPNTVLIGKDEDLGAALQKMTPPDAVLSSNQADVGFIHRKLVDADVYFVANMSNHDVHAQATFRSKRISVSSWDPFAGSVHGLPSEPVALDLAPYESRVIVFSDAPLAPAEKTPQGVRRNLADLSHGWKVQFAGQNAASALDAPKSWTDDPQTRFFSGKAVYTRSITLQAADLSGGRVVLDFGHGKPVDADANIRSGMRALLEGPVREAAVITVNGKRAGSVWRPPYTLDITSELHPGVNTLEVRVANTAINELAGRAPTDYRLLWLRYGQRFIPQDQEYVSPVPSGILGPVSLVEVK